MTVNVTSFDPRKESRKENHIMTMLKWESMCNELGYLIDAPFDFIRKSATGAGYTPGEIEAAFKDYKLAMIAARNRKPVATFALSADLKRITHDQ